MLEGMKEGKSVNFADLPRCGDVCSCMCMLTHVSIERGMHRTTWDA